MGARLRLRRSFADEYDRFDCAEREELKVSMELVLSRVSKEDSEGARNIEKPPEDVPDEPLRELAREPCLDDSEECLPEGSGVAVTA